MKLALGLGHLGSTSIDIPWERIKLAEELGFEMVWCAEIWGHDAVVPLTWIAANTERIGLGTNILQLHGRSPGLTANTMTTLDMLSGGRVKGVGIGLSGPQVIEGWHGQPFGKPAKRVAEYMQIMRIVWDREQPLAFDGEEYRLPYDGPDATGLGKPLKSVLHPRRLPIYVGAMGPINVRNAAEFGDGWVTSRCPPKRLGEYEAYIDEGLRRAGKSRDDFEIAASTQVIVTDDVQEGLNKMKENLALYVGGMGARNMNFHNDQVRRFGYAEAAERIQELFLSGRKREAEEAVPDELCDEIALVGPPDRIRERYRDWEDSRVTMINMGLNTTPEAMQLMAELTGSAKRVGAAV